MTTEKQRKTFLSYSRANKDFAVRLARELKAEGFHVWLDQLDIPLGARWDREVERALEESEIFMIILTPASIDSENVLDEIGYAIDNGKRFLPVLLEKCNVPLRLRRFQYVDFTDKSFDEGVESAKELLRSLIDLPTLPRMGSPSASQVQAEVERRAREEAERLAAEKAEEERLAKQKADREAQAEAERLAQQKAEEKRLAQARADAERKAKEDREAKAEAERIARLKAEDRTAKEKQKIEKRKPQAEPALPKPVPSVARKPEERVAPPRQKSRLPLALGVVGAVVVGLIVVAVAAMSMFNRNSPNTSAPTENPATEALVVTDLPTEMQPTDVLPTSESIPSQPTATKAVAPTQPALPEFFTTKFSNNTDMENYDFFEIGDGDERNLDITSSEDGLVFVLNDQDLYAYYIYEPYTYEDVIVRVQAENIGTLNRNNVSLICRKTGDTWYEYGITSGGLWYLYDYNGEYNQITNGGTTALKTGQQVNDYEMRCIGNNISLYINGQEATTVKSSLYTEGQAGFNISSLDIYPIEIKVLEFEISEP